METISYKIKSVNKRMEILKKNQVEIQELKNTINEMKISLEGPNSIFRHAKERISK